MPTLTDDPSQITELSALEPERPAWLTSELFPFTSHFVDVDGATIHYVDEGSGPVLLFLHGAPMWSFFYREFVERLSDQFRCVALDFPGFGLSLAAEGVPPTVPALAHLVERFIETLDLRNITLVVGDTGGPIGLGVAAWHPERFAGLVLAGTFAWPLEEYPKVARMLRIVSSAPARFVQERTNLLMKYTAGTFGLSMAERAAFLAPYADFAARRNVVTLLDDLAGNTAYMRQIEHTLRTRLRDLPVLLMWGDKDPVYEFLARFQDIYPPRGRW